MHYTHRFQALFRSVQSIVQTCGLDHDHCAFEGLNAVLQYEHSLAVLKYNTASVSFDRSMSS